MQINLRDAKENGEGNPQSDTKSDHEDRIECKGVCDCESVSLQVHYKA